jgi:hypothetical protein
MNERNLADVTSPLVVKCYQIYGFGFPSSREVLMFY